MRRQDEARTKSEDISEEVMADVVKALRRRERPEANTRRMRRDQCTSRRNVLDQLRGL
jgi:hypothetical protein